jgi:hypothetical protein
MFQKKADFSGRYCTQSNPQMMRRDSVTVNEMEFRMLYPRQRLSPRSHRATMKGFSRAIATEIRCAAAILHADWAHCDRARHVYCASMRDETILAA